MKNYYFHKMPVQQLINDFFDLLFPRTCAGCDQTLVTGELHLCITCRHELPYHTDQEAIKKKFANRLQLENEYALLKFNSGGIVQRLLHEIKYRQNPELAIFIGRLMAERFHNELMESGIDLIIPVPLHHSKERTRGYNQSEKLALGIAEVLAVPIASRALIRTKKNETQTKKSRGERWQNVANIFEVNEIELLRNKHVLLVDDVITTGATAESCGHALLAAGISQLSLTALADA